jgi:multidrug efflux system membrane fusion protein
MSQHKFLRPRYLLAFLALVIFAALYFFVGSGKDKVHAAAPRNAGRPPAPVIVASVEQRDIPVELDEIGNVQAYRTVQIRSQVNGEITRIYFHEGQDVRPGQLLFSLDKRPFQADLDKALGQLKRDQATAANSKAQAARDDALERDGVLAPQAAEQQRAQAQADASAVYADQAAVEAARVQLAYTDISAPIAGRAGAILINLGNLVKANDTPYLVQLNQITPIYVSFTIPEGRLDQVRQRFDTGHLPVFASPKSDAPNAPGQRPAEGYLTFIDNGVDPQTGTVMLKATFTNQDRRLWPGEFVNVVLDLSTVKGATVVPTKAIQTGQQGDYVYVVTAQNVAEPRLVKTAGTYHDLSVVSSGIAPGERVVVEGQLRLAPNAKVVVQNTAPTNGSSQPPPAGGGQ